MDHPPALLRDRLLKEGYTDSAIQAAMGENYPSAEQAMQECKDFVALTKPRLVLEAEDLGAQVVNDQQMQLYVIPGFLEPELCQALVEICREHAKPSSTELDTRSTYRTSSTSPLYRHMGKPVAIANQRITKTLGLNLSYAEPLQGQIYGTQQEYKTHSDYQPQATLNQLRQSFNRSGQRTWTFMVYLNKPRKGGHTEFPGIGEKIEPEIGKAVVWNNLKPNGNPNPYTEHRGCPVEKGSKIILTKWFRAEGFGPVFNTPES